jgi:macrolide transport system ATP-binding/permease protein
MNLWRRLFHRRKLEHELDAELRFHLEEQERDYIRTGMSEPEARRKATVSFGGIEGIKEDCREVRSISLVESTAQDIRYAERSMRKLPLFSVVVVLSLALGIGANTAIFSLIDALMWRMLPVKDPENLVYISRIEDGIPQTGFTYRQYRALQDAQVSEIAGYSAQRASVTIDGNLEPTAEVHLVSGNYFSLLGVPAITGRTFTTDDDQIPNGHPVVMLSYGYWTRRFDRDPSVIGKVISFSARPFTVIGITPPRFFGTEVGTAPDLFVPIMMQPTIMGASENLLEAPIIYSTWIQTLARLKPDISPAQAAAMLEPAYLQNGPPRKLGMEPPVVKIIVNSAAMGISALRRQFSKPLIVLMSVVGMVLLIACANIANLFLARAASRRGEFALRLAIGAARGRLARQLLAETVILGILGGAVALVVSHWAMRILLLYISAGRSPVVLDLNPSFRAFAFTGFVSIATGIVLGLATAVRATRLDLSLALKNSQGIGRRASLGPHRVLAVMQVALSLVLLIGAGLFARSLGKLDSQADMLPRDRVLVVRLEPTGSDQRNLNGTLERLHRIYTDLLERVSSIPGVQSASLANVSPLKPTSGCCGARDPATGQVRLIPQVMVYPKFFETMGIPIVRGENFRPEDFVPNAAPVAVVNETFARNLFNGDDPIGEMLNQTRIIGVAKDTRYVDLKRETEPTSYVPFLAARTGRGQMILHVRTAIEPAAIVPLIRQEVWKADPMVPQSDVHTLSGEIDSVLAHERLLSTVSMWLGGLALVLASVGLYGLLAFAVTERRSEIGMRLALGAMRGNVMWMILKQAFALALTGVALGGTAAVTLIHFGAAWFAGLLFGLNPVDPETIVGAAAVLLVVVTVAAYLPARRASLVDPMVVLRDQ